MQEGVVIFSQKDVDDGLMGAMESFAGGLGLSVPDMVRQVFVRRMATDLAYYDVNKEHNLEFYEDKALASGANELHFFAMASAISENVKKEITPDVPEVVQ